MGEEVSNIPVLEKNNYEEWRVKMEGYLSSKGLLDCLFHEGKAEDFEVLSVLRRKCGIRAKAYIRGVISAKDAWEQLAIMSRHPTDDLVATTRTFYTWYPQLYKAIEDGDWVTAEHIFRNNKGALTARLTSDGETALHIAVLNGHVKIVKKLVKKMSKESLTIQDKYDRTAVHIAASGESLKIVEVLVKKNKDPLLTVIGYCSIPIVTAVRAERGEIARFLYPFTMDMMSAQDPKELHDTRVHLITSFIWGDFCDLAFDLLKKYPNLAQAEDRILKMTPLQALSRKPFVFRSSFEAKERRGFGILGFYLQKMLYWCCTVETSNPSFSKEDVENSIRSSKHSSDQAAVPTMKSRVCVMRGRLCGIFQSFIKIVPFLSTIYNKKATHVAAQNLLDELWKITLEKEEENMLYGDWDELFSVIIEATQHGIVEFIDVVMKSCPFLLRTTIGDTDWSIFHYAITHRQPHIFSRIHQHGALKVSLTSYIDKDANSMLHLAANVAPTHRLHQVPGPVLKMQHEVLWYKEVKKVVPRTFEGLRNKSDNQTPRELFKKNHETLLKDASEWMKETATQCMVVATLIATIMFAAAFTVPGGMQSGDTGAGGGHINYAADKYSMVFITSDVLALSSSIASVLIFLAIITSRHAEEDFLRSLPRMLSMGLIFLFISIVGMMIAFVMAILALTYRDIHWAFLPLVLLASIPITVYALVEFPLLLEMTFAAREASFFGTKKYT